MTGPVCFLFIDGVDRRVRKKAITIAAKFRDCLGARENYRAIVVVSVGTPNSISLPRTELLTI